MTAFPKSGLYAITQCENKSPDQIIEEVKAAIRGGAVVIQYRDKKPVDALYLATELARICRLNNIPLIINDNMDLCLQSNADGVHLGKEDFDISEARKYLGDEAVIGVSCYNSLERALNAQSLGASYVAFGRFFPSSSKPLPVSTHYIKQSRSFNSRSLPSAGFYPKMEIS
jgi:thiamine-phosphate pyrophosphorylase